MFATQAHANLPLTQQLLAVSCITVMTDGLGLKFIRRACSNVKVYGVTGLFMFLVVGPSRWFRVMLTFSGGSPMDFFPGYHLLL